MKSPEALAPSSQRAALGEGRITSPNRGVSANFAELLTQTSLESTPEAERKQGKGQQQRQSKSETEASNNTLTLNQPQPPAPTPTTPVLQDEEAAGSGAYGEDEWPQAMSSALEPLLSEQAVPSPEPESEIGDQLPERSLVNVLRPSDDQTNPAEKPTGGENSRGSPAKTLDSATAAMQQARRNPMTSPEETPKTEESAKGDGIGAAPLSLPMNYAGTQNENASSQEQNLPANGDVPTVETPEKAGTTFEVLSAQPQTGTGTLSGETIQTASAASERESTVETVERLQRTFGDEVVRVKHNSDSSVSVVLRPQPGVQVTLHLQLLQGRVQASAELQEGSWAALSSDWANLQKRLEDQGISLAPLGTSVGTGTDSHPQGHRSAFRMPTLEGEVAIFKSLPKTTVNQKVTSRGSTLQSCEFWA